MEEPLALEPFFPDRNSQEPLAAQLTRRLREAIQNGTLPAGTRLLGTRQLAKRLGLGRNTVALAFEQLSAEGYLLARVGSRTTVVGSRDNHAIIRGTVGTEQPTAALGAAALRRYFAISTGRGPLRPGMPDLSRFPHAAWEQSARKAAAAYRNDLGYGRASGMKELQIAIASHVRQFRGITALPRQIIITEGAQAAFNLIASVLAAPGDSVIIEDPCYALARAVFEINGLTLLAVAADREGICIDQREAHARLAYVTPTHQYPLGGTLPIARRNELLRWAVRENAYVIEDDYDSEFTSRMQPLPPLQCLDREERVIYVGSFSKTLAPGIRVGYLIAPPHLVDAFTVARAVSGLGIALTLQATLAQLIASGHFARHVHRMNKIYDRRRSILTEALQPALRAGFRLGPTFTGLHVTLLADGNFDDLAAADSVDGQRLIPLSALCIDRTDCRGFLLGFTNGEDEEIAAAGSAVAAALARS